MFNVEARGNLLYRLAARLYNKFPKNDIAIGMTVHE